MQFLAGCPLQDMDDGYGQKLYQTVEMYADDQGTKYLFIFKIRNIF